MRQFTRDERGSALVESAILMPVFILLVMISAAVTDVMILKLKAAEAVRYALWETTIFKPPAQIQDEVRAKFADLKSPQSLETQSTGLLLYPLASDLSWQASVDTTSTKAGLGGQRADLGSGFWSEALGTVANALGSSVDTVTKSQGFNQFGVAKVTVTLQQHSSSSKSILLPGGDLVGARGGNALAMPEQLVNLSFQAPLPGERPMQLVFDTWKAWPKPADYTSNGGSTDLTVSPMQTYPMVEQLVSAQEKKIAFAGLTGMSWFNRLNGIGAKLLGNGVTEALSGGKLPQIFSTELMDGPQAGPITILPVEVPQESWAPSQCEVNGRQQTCGTQRLGALISTSQQFLGDDDAMGAQVDSTRYTVPFKLNSRYWTKSGGVNELSADTASLQALPDAMASESVSSWNCRGHFFAGAQTAQQTDRAARYSGSSGSCP
jgi:Flp pilus assembly pilin Flp